MLQAIESGVQRALLNLEEIFGDLLDAQEDAVAMQRAKRDGFEDEHVQSALEKFELLGHAVVSPR
jgi:hypothetical protein